MALMDILASAQGGNLFAAVGQATSLDAAAAKKALSAMAPAIAAQLKIKSAEDPSTFDALLDLLEDGGSVIDDASLLTDAEAISDGNAVLDEIYGSRDQAIRTMRQLAPEVPETSLSKLAAIGATAVLGALAKSNTPAPMALTGAQPLTGGSGGILGTILSALVKGAVQSVTRQLAPRRRRRSATSYFGHRKKRSTTKRRTRSPTLEDIFGEILGTRRS
jgi:hypothetical protein